MSRLAKKPIILPEKTTITVAAGIITVTGPLGTLTRPLHPSVKVTITGNEAMVESASSSSETKAMLGTMVAHIRNMVNGVTKGYEKRLMIEGVGYKWDVKPKELGLAVGFSHPVAVPIPTGLKVALEKNVLVVSGADIEMVGQFSAKVRSLKKPEPYKGKGIRYSTETIRRKQGKKAA
jgi:large subunit ribosomal protein L6